MFQLSLTLDALPPSVNRIYRPGGGGRKLLVPEVEVFRALMLQAVLDVYGGKPIVPPGEELEAFVLFVPKDRRVCDVDNTLKAVLDALQCCLLNFNDRQIRRLHAERSNPSRRGCKTYIRLQTYTAAGAADWFKRGEKEPITNESTTHG